MFSSGQEAKRRPRRPVYETPRIVDETPLELWSAPQHLRQPTEAPPPKVDPIAFAQSKLPPAGWAHCPYLGLSVAPDVVELWPSAMHACFAAGKVDASGEPDGEAVTLEQQADVCLSPTAQRACVRYAAAVLRDLAASGRAGEARPLAGRAERLARACLG
jgi:hypothetical protein